MKDYRAVSSAIYGPSKEQLVMSVSVVAARDQQDIRLEYTDKKPIDTGSIASVRERFDWLHQTIVDTTHKQIAVAPNLSTPVVFGVPENFAGLDLTDTLRRTYADVLKIAPMPLAQRLARERIKKDKRKKQRSQTDDGISEKLRRFLDGTAGLVGRGTRERQANEKDGGDDRTVWDLDKALVEELMRKALGKTKGLDRQRMSFHPRLFKPLEHGVIDDMKDEGRRTEIAARLLDAERTGLLLELKARTEAGDALAHQMLRAYAIARADNAMRGYATRVPLHRADSRFILVAPPIPPFSTSPEYNFLQWFDLRTVFGERVMHWLQSSHPICVKAPGDAVSPAFADVAATYAYQLKVYAETGTQFSPAVVMIRHENAASSTNPPATATEEEV